MIDLADNRCPSVPQSRGARLCGPSSRRDWERARGPPVRLVAGSCPASAGKRTVAPPVLDPGRTSGRPRRHRARASGWRRGRSRHGSPSSSPTAPAHGAVAAADRSAGCRQPPADDPRRLYHRRRRAETCCFSPKSTVLDGRVLRSRSVPGLEQEIFALLTVHQALVRLADDVTTATPGLSVQRVGFTVLFQAAADQIIVAPEPVRSSTASLIGATDAGPDGQRAIPGWPWWPADSSVCAVSAQVTGVEWWRGYRGCTA